MRFETTSHALAEWENYFDAYIFFPSYSYFDFWHVASSSEGPDYSTCYMIVVIPEFLSLATFGIKSDAVFEAVYEDELTPLRNK